MRVMTWLSEKKAPIAPHNRVDRAPKGLWRSCDSCHAIMLTEDFKKNFYLCTKCDAHEPFPVKDRIASLVDAGSFVETHSQMRSSDPLNFTDTKKYSDRLLDLQKKLGYLDAVVTGKCSIHKHPVYLGVFNFEFLGGSMGSVVGEKIARLFLESARDRCPAIIVTSSGGARMQEGIVSLFQMAKTCAALTKLKDLGLPFISVLCHPTTGGVAASFAMLGDINLGEPGALIGFAGPRVIQQTIRAQLPEGFQTAEYLLEHGMLDFICHRKLLRDRLGQLLNLILVKPRA